MWICPINDRSYLAFWTAFSIIFRIFRISNRIFSRCRCLLIHLRKRRICRWANSRAARSGKTSVSKREHTHFLARCRYSNPPTPMAKGKKKPVSPEKSATLKKNTAKIVTDQKSASFAEWRLRFPIASPITRMRSNTIPAVAPKASAQASCLSCEPRYISITYLKRLAQKPCFGA